MKIRIFAIILTTIILLTSLPACTSGGPGNGTGTPSHDTSTDSVPDGTTGHVPDTEDTSPENTDVNTSPDTEPDTEPGTEPVETLPPEDVDHPLSGKLVINEVCSSNKTIYADKKGEFADWLELTNASDETIQLEGIGLSKNEEEPYALTLPEMTLAPNAFLLVFCSKNEKAGLHDSNVYAPFNIGADGETLFLSAPAEGERAGALIDTVSVPKLKTDDVYARSQDGIGQFSVMTPTPNRSNRSAKEIKYISAPTLSHGSGFYKKEILLTAKANGGTVYYTTDCSDPLTSETRDIFRGELRIEDATKNPNIASAEYDFSIGGKNKPAQSNVDKCTVIRAVAVDRDGYASDVVTGVYFVGETAEIYKDVAVVSLSADHKDLFSPDRGIYVIGSTYYEWLNSPDYVQYNNADKKNPANYNQDGREWEREATFQYFENGQALYGTDCGVRIAGNWSRQAAQKSLRVYARGEYGDGKFSYPFFGGLTDVNGKPIDKFDKLTLSSGGNDWWQTKMTNTVISDAVVDTNIDTMATKPCILFLNGEFWGMYFLAEKQEDEHFESHYGVKAENITTVKTGSTEGSNAVVSEYKKVMNKLLTADASDPEVYKQFSELIDLDSLIDYIAIETYIINTDWSKENSNNNWMMWRSNTVDPSNPYADGKWRFVLFDVDAGGKKDVTTDLLSNMNKQEKWSSFSTIFYKLCENQEFIDRFYNRAKEIIQINFAPARMKTIIDDYAAQCKPWVEKTYTRFSLSQVYDEKLGIMRHFYNNRPEHALKQLAEFCGKK